MIDFAARRRALAIQGKIAPVYAVEVWNPLTDEALELRGAEPTPQAAYALSLEVGRAIYAHLKVRVVVCAPPQFDGDDGIPMLLAA